MSCVGACCSHAVVVTHSGRRYALRLRISNAIAVPGQARNVLEQHALRPCDGCDGPDPGYGRTRPGPARDGR